MAISLSTSAVLPTSEFSGVGHVWGNYRTREEIARLESLYPLVFLRLDFVSGSGPLSAAFLTGKAIQCECLGRTRTSRRGRGMETAMTRLDTSLQLDEKHS